MLHNEQLLKQKIINFGISSDATDVYLALIKSGPVGIMELCRHIGLGRNVVYKHLAELTETGLVSIAEKSFGKQYSAKQGSAFEALLASKEAKLSSMRSNLEHVTQGLLALAGEEKATSKIVHFEGIDGLEQVNWNLTKASKEFRVYEQSHIDEYLDQSFARKLRQRYTERGLVSYDLTNRKKVDVYTDAASDTYWLSNSYYRYISPKILEIQFELYTYDNVVTLLDYGSTEPHCIEIHNDRLATMQRQIFDLIWAQARPMVHDSKTKQRVLKK